MNKRIISLSIFCIGFIADSYAQTFIPAVRFYYDATGKRFLRKMGTICIGIDCPIEPSMPPFKPEVKDSTKSDAAATMENVIAYPNPVTEELSVDNRTWKDGDKASVIVFDISGKADIKKELIHAKGSIQFHDIAPGTYMVQYYLNGTPIQEWKIIRL